MLRKLLKYEIKATSRIYLPMYALLIVFALINKFFIAVNADYLKIPMMIAMTVFVVIIVGICVMTLVVTIQRFNKNLLTDEGYLSFTLPVKVHTHVDAKMIVALLWSVLSAIVGVVSVFVMAINEDTIQKWSKFMSELIPAFNSLGAAGYVIVLEGIILVVVATLSAAVKIYAAITIGNMSSKHRLLVGLGAYLGFGVIEQIIVSIFGSSMSSRIEIYFRNLDTIASKAAGAETALLWLIVYTLIFGALYYFLTNWMLKKKLNLE
jgi:hypothetical protein